MDRDKVKFINEVELAWLAGLLEGEGAFFISKYNVNGKTYRYPTISVNMTDKDVIDRVSLMFGVKTFCGRAYGSTRLPPFRAFLTGDRAARFMQRILPHMGKRRQQKIQEILREWDSREMTEVKRKRSCSIFATTRSRSESGQFIRG